MDSKDNLDLSLIPNELKLLIEIIKLENNKQDKVSKIIMSYEKIDWKLFIELALHHRVYPLLYTKIKAVSNELIPNFVIQKIEGLYKNNIFQMLYLCNEMDQINKICNDKKIPLLFLKGPVLAFELYGDISLRTSSDIDILVPINKLEKMENLLRELGFIKDDYIETILNDWKWRHHHVTYIHPKKEVKVEIHWRLNPGPGKEPSFDELWSRKRISLVTTNPIYFLGKEDLFLFLVSHGARHGWSRLRWLLDIHKLVKMDLNWKDLQELLRKNNFLQIGGQALLLTSHLLDSEINEDVKMSFFGSGPRKLAQKTIFYLERMVNLHTLPLPEDVSKYHSRYLFQLMNPQQKLFFILSLLYPYPADAKTLPLPQKIHFLYFPLRPFLWVWRRSRKQALQ